MASSMGLAASANQAAVRAAEKYFRAGRYRPVDDLASIGLANVIFQRLLQELPGICARGDALARAGMPEVATDLTLAWAAGVGLEEASKAVTDGESIKQVSVEEWAKLHPASAKSCDEMAAEIARSLGVPPGSVKVLKTEGGSAQEAVAKMVEELTAGGEAPGPIEGSMYEEAIAAASGNL
jgi:hypothetical protein